MTLLLPEQAAGYVNLGAAYDQLEKYSQAVEVLTKAVKPIGQTQNPADEHYQSAEFSVRRRFKSPIAKELVARLSFFTLRHRRCPAQTDFHPPENQPLTQHSFASDHFRSASC